METLARILTLEPLVSLAAIILGWGFGICQWVGRRGDRKTAAARHDEILAGFKELLSRMEQMPGKTKDEQERIVKEAKAIPIVMELSAGRPVVGDLNVTARKSPKPQARNEDRTE